MTRVPVSGEGFRPYDVLVGPGLIDEAGARIAALFAGRRAAVVSDETVAGLHGARLVASLQAAGLKPSLTVVPPGEASKAFGPLERLCDALLDTGLDRKDVIVALGGGVVGDLAGFAAAILMRGVDFVQIPTTLLAQVDSSVGGKTAIDTARGKNLIGAFWQPRLVLCDLDALATLPAREVRAGYAEVVKYGLLGDAAFFDWLETNGARALALEPRALGEAVARSVAAKAAIVAEDPREAGRRALLNLGHTFGHAIESETGFGLLHGEAVAIGCAQAFRFSARQGLCSAEDAARVEAALAAAGLPTRPPEGLDPERLLARMTQDKKAEGGALTLILARAIGDAFVARDMDAATVLAFLREEQG